VLLVDTNVWLAAADRRSHDHDNCRTLLEAHRGELAATALVVAETAWLLLDRGGPRPQRNFLSLITSRQLEVVNVTTKDWERVVELVDTYADLELDAIDASTVAVAERLDLTMIATLDHRDFRTVRPTHCDAFTLLPGDET
jgi:uncharacterized protein